MLFSLMAPLMYLIGSGFNRRKNNYNKYYLYQNPKISSKILFSIYTALVVILALQGQGILFTGYSEIIDFSLQGQMATLEMLILYQYLYERSNNRSIANYFLILIAINSIILLSLGGRIYVASALTAIYFRWWNWDARSVTARIFALFTAFVILTILVAIGMWRVGDDDASRITFYLLAESLFTSISGFTLFTSGKWELIEIPIEFFLGFLNIIPSAIWPEKAEWLASKIASSQHFEAPMGAVSIVASSVGNFGFLGGLIFFLIVGTYMRISERRAKSGDPAQIAYYCYLISLLPFIFFRDPFQIQIKLLLTGFLINTIIRKINLFRLK